MNTADAPETAIRVRTVTLREAFQSLGWLKLPWAQRAYAWREDHVLRLFGDIVAAYNAARIHYPLGLIRLAGRESDRSFSVIDGQQRLISLTILFALLRDRVSDASRRGEISRCIIAGNDQGEQPVPILQVQDYIAPFLFETVQKPGATHMPQASPEHELAEAEANVIANRDALFQAVERCVGERVDLDGLADFLLDRCTVVVLCVDDPREAWDMLAIEEETGLPFHATERSKVSLISVMPRVEQLEAARIWEYWQRKLGNDMVGDLLNHIRTIATCEDGTQKSKTPVETDLARLFRLDRGGLEFMRSAFNGYAADLADMLSVDEAIKPHALGPPTKRRAAAMRQLGWLDQNHWVAPGLLWLKLHGHNHAETTDFFIRLDRLAWLVRISGLDPNRREARFFDLVSQIKAGRQVTALEALHIDDEIRLQALNNLSSRTFFYKPYAHLVLRRLSVLLDGPDPGPRDGQLVTSEHILPRRPPQGSQWLRDFDQANTPTDYSDRIGNFALLNATQNQLAGNHDWRRKAEILAHSGFKLAEEAARWDVWTPATIETRSRKMIAMLFEDWGLALGETS